MLPKHLKPQMDAATKHHVEGRLAAALQLYERLLPSDPSSFDLHHRCGLACYQLGRMDKALILLERACRLNPKSAATFMVLGLVQRSFGRFTEAEAALREAIRLSPQAYEAWSNLGSLLVSQNRLSEAVDAFRKAVAANPKDAGSWSKLGSACKQVGLVREAIEYHGRALELDPRHPSARRGRAEAFQAQNKSAEAIAELDAHLAFFPKDLGAMSMRLMLLNYSSSISAQVLFEEHLRYGRLAREQENAKQRPAAFHPDRHAGNKRLHVAFLSGDFRRHSVAFFIRPILAHLSRDEFEITLYHDHFCLDAVSEDIKGLVPHWRHVHGLDADALEKRIREDAPDILIDLSGHTSIVRLPLFVRRLAPLQMTYLGYPNTTGLQEMDFRLVDSISDPEGKAEGLHTEKLLRFSSCAWCYEPPVNAPIPGPSPCIGADQVCFGSFNAFFKYSPATLDLWRQLLARIPNSRLLLKCIGADPEEWGSKLAAAGLDPARVRILAHREALADHLACYDQVDIGLDSFPFNGTTTTCEALWMGVPVVSLAGDRHAARVGASLLSAVGLQDLVAQSPDEYIEIASLLASDRDRLQALRSSLRSRMRESALMKPSDQAARFGAALRGAWRTWCGQA